MKIVIATNAYPNGLNISDEGCELLCKKIGVIPKPSLTWDIRYDDVIARNSPALVGAVEELGERFLEYGTAKVVEVPDDAKWAIGIDENEDEFVYDESRSWR